MVTDKEREQGRRRQEKFGSKTVRLTVSKEAGEQLDTLRARHGLERREMTEKLIDAAAASGDLFAERKPLPPKEKAAALLKQHNGDRKAATDSHYAAVRAKYPGYVYQDGIKKGDEHHEAHRAYDAVRRQIHLQTK